MTELKSLLSAEPEEAKITDAAIQAAREMIGLILRPEGPYLQDATHDTLRNFCNGIGDLNPLYRDQDYARATRHGGQIAHPMFPYAYGWPGRTRWGLPGVHGFYAGNDWEFFRSVRPGDQVSCVERVIGVEEKTSRFSGRLVLQYVQASFVNQRDELIADVLGWCTRHERRAAREAGKYRDIKRHTYAPEEVARIEELGLAEQDQIAGKATRYFEDMTEGDELPPIVRGPLSLMDTIGFLVGCGRGKTHGVLLQEAVRHPSHFFRSEQAGQGVEYTGIGHHREEIAQSVGAPGTYDYGPQRTAWIASLVTNWMGDAAFLKRLRAEMRGFNTVGDTTWCKGKVVRKYEKDGYPLVDLEVWAENQRGEVTAPGVATVMVPSRQVDSPIVLDASSLRLDLPLIR